MKNNEKLSNSDQNSSNDPFASKIFLRSNRVDISKVEPHPSVMEVYAPKKLDGLKVTMNLVGQIESIKVVLRDDKFLIFDGVSRYLSAVELGWKSLVVEIFEYTDQEIQDRFVLHNFRTRRSYKEICRQAEVILGILGLSQGKKRERIGSLESPENDFGLAGKDRFEIACDILGFDFSASTLRRLLAVKEFDDNGSTEEKGFKLLDKIENEQLKIHQAYNFISTYKSSKNEQGTNALTEVLEIVTGKDYKLFNQSCEDLSNIPDDSVDCVVTSPPYYKQRNYRDGIRDKSVPQHGQENTVDEYIEKEIEIYSGVYKKLKTTGSLFIIISDTFCDGSLCMAVEKLIIGMREAGWYPNQKIYWKKENSNPSNDNSKRLLLSYEYVLHMVKDPKRFYYREFKYWKDDSEYSFKKNQSKSSKSWWLKKPIERFRNFLIEQQVRQVILANGFNPLEFKEVDPKFSHPAPYPSVIPVLPILLTTKIGDTVLDIFNGSSTTTAIALQLGRKAIGYDTDTESHLFAMKRLKMVEEINPNLKRS